MPNVIVYIAMSLDGYIAGARGNVEWLDGDNSSPGDAGSYPLFIETVDTVVMGWNTYHQIVTELSPAQWPYDGKMTYVITHRDIAAQPNIVFTSQELTALVADLRKRSAQNIWICGGASIIQQLIGANLIDEYCISVIPILLGEGKRLFGNFPRTIPLRLIKTQVYNGITDLVYARRTD